MMNFVFRVHRSGFAFRVFCGLSLPDGFGGFEAVHLRHLYVHQNEIKSLPFQSGQRLFAVACYYDCVPSLF